MERSPAVAGLFYPADPGELRRTLDGCLGQPAPASAPPVAVMVPHAGYVYSGRTAGRVYREVPVPAVALLLGPNHTGRGRPAAVWTRGRGARRWARCRWRRSWRRRWSPATRSSRPTPRPIAGSTRWRSSCPSCRRCGRI